MIKNKWRARLAGLLVVLLFTAACVETVLIGLGGAAAIGTYKWIEGTMEKDYPRGMQDTWNATLAAAKTLNLKIASQQYGALESKLEAVQPPDTTVKVQLIARPNQITTVKIRVGMLRNADYSAYFHRQIMQNMGVPPG